MPIWDGHRALEARVGLLRRMGHRLRAVPTGRDGQMGRPKQVAEYSDVLDFLLGSGFLVGCVRRYRLNDASSVVSLHLQLACPWKLQPSTFSYSSGIGWDLLCHFVAPGWVWSLFRGRITCLENARSPSFYDPGTRSGRHVCNRQQHRLDAYSPLC